MDKQYGGWYDNPATGRNQRWFNGVWTDGAEPGGSSGSMKDAYNQTFSGIASEVNKYADELIKFAEDDYNFAAKWIEANYKLALGEDDTERAKFLKEVANSLEQKVGRIAFDYQTGQYRLSEDRQVQTQRTNETLQTALNRLSEDEAVYRQQEQRLRAEEQQDTAESLNERGILAGSPQDATGLAGKEIRDLTTEQNERLAAFERQLGRDREDVSREGRITLEDIERNYARSSEDLTTQARRGAQDETQQRDYGLESAARERDRRKLAAEQERRRALNQARTYADYTTRGALGIG